MQDKILEKAILLLKKIAKNKKSIPEDNAEWFKLPLEIRLKAIEKLEYKID